MKYIELMEKKGILANVPLAFEGRELPSKLQAKLMLMRVGYDKVVAQFQDKLQEVLKGLKSEGFDALAADAQKVEGVESRASAFEKWNGEGDKPTMPTDEELKEAKDIRESGKYEEYQKELKTLTEKYNEAYRLELLAECDYSERKFTEDEYAEIVAMMGTGGKIDFLRADGEKVEIAKVDLLAMVAANFVD